MRKAISLKVSLWIEGEDEPAHDFAASTKQAVEEIIQAGLSKHPELKVTIKSVGERGVDDSPAPKKPEQAGGAGGGQSKAGGNG